MSFDNYGLAGAKNVIYEIIISFPGIHLRELKRKTNFSMGQLTHHVYSLKRKSIIDSFRHNHNLRFFAPGFSEREKIIISNLRNDVSKKMILKIMDSDTAQKELSDYVCLSPSTVSWYVGKLKNDGIISIKPGGKSNLCFINQKHEVLRVLKNYKESFLDKMTSNFIKAWET